MCRNIKTLRAPYAVGVTDDDVHAAALQYVRTVGGIRIPSPNHAEAFNQAVDAISVATRALLSGLEASQGHVEANPGNPAASPERLDASPEHSAASPEQPGGLVPYGRPIVPACEISMESGGVRSTPSGSLR
jgi:hypothetical protein